MINIKLDNEQATVALACDLARLLPFGVTVLLNGDLGAGKTFFTRAFIQSLMGDFDYTVASPTFNLLHIHETSEGPVYHYDLYRIEDPDELQELGFDDTHAARATLIEWPDRLNLSHQILNKVVVIQVNILKDGGRHVEIDLKGLINQPQTAFVFAAGLGERMRPLTDVTPKPLIPVAGRPILDDSFDRLYSAGVRNIFMNTHYLAAQIQDFAARWSHSFNIKILHEDSLLETGGGMKRAIPDIQEDIFFALNGDVMIDDHPGFLPYLSRLSLNFDPDRMDILLLLMPVDQPSLTPLIGDYFMDADGTLRRALGRDGTHMFTGARILHRRVFDHSPDGRFSFLTLMDRAQAQGRLFGLTHLGDFYHLSTAHDVQVVHDYLISSKKVSR